MHATARLRAGAAGTKNPGPLRRIVYALGCRLPVEYRDWVRHDLTDAGWRGRMVGRHVLTLTPVCLAATPLPGEWWIRAMSAALVLIGGVFTVAISADELRRSRLFRHGIDPDE